MIRQYVSEKIKTQPELSIGLGDKTMIYIMTDVFLYSLIYGSHLLTEDNLKTYLGKNGKSDLYDLILPHFPIWKDYYENFIALKERFRLNSNPLIHSIYDRFKKIFIFQTSSIKQAKEVLTNLNDSLIPIESDYVLPKPVSITVDDVIVEVNNHIALISSVAGLRKFIEELMKIDTIYLKPIEYQPIDIDDIPEVLKKAAKVELDKQKEYEKFNKNVSSFWVTVDSFKSGNDSVDGMMTILRHYDEQAQLRKIERY